MKLKKFHNLLYFNFFRFQCFLMRLVAKPIYLFFKAIGLDNAMARKHGRANWENYLIDDVLNNQKSGVSLFLADRFIGLIYVLVVFIFWNVGCALLRLDFFVWKYGSYVLLSVCILAIFAFNHEYLDDFKEFDTWTASESRKSVLITVVTIGSVILSFAATFAWYMNVALS